MESLFLPVARQQLDRFCLQYLQLQQTLDYPDEELLRRAEFQDAIFAKLFKPGAVQYGPPPRYQFRVLKELTKRIENSIRDWEEEVCNIYRFAKVRSKFSFCIGLTAILSPGRL